jgi:hypothetical protein
MTEDLRYEEESVPLAAGDRLVLYTDGVTEAARADGEMFGEERLTRLVASLPHDLAARELVERILAGLREFLGEAEPGDDVTVMALRVLPEPTASRHRDDGAPADAATMPRTESSLKTDSNGADGSTIT